MVADHGPEVPFYKSPATSAPSQVRDLVTREIPENPCIQYPNPDVILSVGTGVSVVRMIKQGLADDVAAYITFSLVLPASRHVALPA